MSFVAQGNTGKAYAPGWFLADNEHCTRETRQMAADNSQVATAQNGGKYMPMGAFYPANDSSTVEGIVYEDVDVSSGDMPGSVVTKGTVYLDRLPASPGVGVQSALEGKGFKFYANAPSVVRPDERDSLDTITIVSAAGTNAGDTALTITYTPGAGESYRYKVASGTAPAAVLHQFLDNTWTAWDGTSDITAATDSKITVASVDITGAVVAAGNATVTAKA